MSKLDIIYFVIISIIGILFILFIFGYSFRYNYKIGRNNSKKVFLDKNNILKKSEGDKNYIINELITGGIKCHKLPNSAKKYNEKKWVKKMFIFMEQPEFDDLMNIGGNDVDGDREYQG